jgi:hypothetical protein
MPVIKECLHCKKEFSVIPYKADTAKYCSKKCKWDFHGWSSEPNTTCAQCGKEFHLKPFNKKRLERSHGYFCSNVCVGVFRSSGVYDGNKNPNYRGRTEDSDGYSLRTYVEHCSGVNGLKGMKLHQAVCCEIFDVKKIGMGLHVHHRDCDVRNNEPTNLSILCISDHKWLHKQFGNATLWAHYHGKINTESLVAWSDDKDRAARLLDASVLNQSIEQIGVVIDGLLIANSETARGGDGFGSTDRVE